MAKFQLTDKSGATYEIDAPDEHAAVAALGQVTNGSQQPSAPAAPAASKGTLQTIDDYVRAAANGATFGLADRFAAGMGSLTGIGGKSGDYTGNLQSEQAKTDQFASDHPIASIGANLAGGAVVPLGAIGAAAKGASLGTKTLLGMGAGAGLGTVQGALSSRDLTDLPQTGKEAIKGAILGGTIGAAIPGAGSLIGKGYNGLANMVNGSAQGMSRAATGHLVSAAEADGLPAVQAQMARLGPDATLADAGPAFLGKAQGASLNSDEGRSVLQSALTARNEGTNARIMGDVNKALGPAEDPQTVTNAIKNYRSTVDAQSYPAALNNGPDVQTAPILQQLQDMIPNSVGSEKKALTSLQDMMMKTEKRPVMDASGYPVFDHLGHPKFQDVKVSQNDPAVLHKVKQELDNVIEYDAPGLGVPAGALTRQQGALKNFRGQLNGALEDQVPGYFEANRQSAALARRGQSVDLGTQYLGSGKTTASPERFSSEFSRLEPGEQIAFAKGSRGNIERVLGTKANDLQALRSELQGEGGWNTAKIAAVHGQDAADQLVGTVDRNLKFRDTYNKVVENSQTAQRQAAANAMKPTAETGVPFFGPATTATGMTVTAAKKAITGVVNAIMRSDPTKSYGEVARILSAQGPQRDAHISAIAEAMNRRQSNAAMAPKVGDRTALIAAILGNAYAQSGPRGMPERR